MVTSKKDKRRKANKPIKASRDPNSTVAFRIVADNGVAPPNMHIPDYIKRSWERKAKAKGTGEAVVKPKAKEPATATVTPEKVIVKKIN